MNIKPHIKSAFLYSLIINVFIFYFNPISNEENWAKIAMVFLVSVLVGAVIISILRAAGYAMMKSFTEPEDGPLS